MTELAAISSHKYGVAESGLIGFVTRIKELDKVNIPNVRQIGQALTELNAVASKHKFNTLNAQLPKFITEISRLHSIQLPNVKQIGQGVAELAKLSNHKFGTVEQGLIKVVDRLKDLNGVQLPNVKQIGQAIQILNEYSSNATIAASKLGVLRTELGQWNNIQLPNLKNIADGFKILNDTTVKYNTVKFGGTTSWGTNIHNAALAIKTAFAGFSDIQLPNVKNVAEGFRILNELTIQNNKSGHANLTANIHKLKQALSQLKDLDGTAFPNVKNISEGMQNLTKLGPIAQDLNSTFQTVANALQHVNGIKVPKLKDFTDGFEQLKTIVSKSTGTMETSKFAQDMTALSAALSGFGKVSLPPNLSGFAKGIESITKVNVGLFSTQFKELMAAINGFKIDTNNAALNHFTAVLTLAASAIQQINGKLGQAQSQFGSFGRSVDQVINPMDKLVERFKMFMQYRVISTVFSSITNQLRNVPSAIIEFEKGMYNIQSITGATNESMSKLGDVIKHVAGNTKFSVQEIADGMTTIAQAGFTAGQSMQMIQSISNLATGTLSDMKTTVDLATSAMVVFGIESHQAARVSDVFANAVNKSKLNMDKIKTAFNYIGPVARDANISFEETAVAMMLLANNGQKASTIGTGLRNVFSTLLSPSKKLEAAASAAGVALSDLDPRANSLRDVLSKLNIVVKDSQVALDVFGKRGATAVLGLTQSMGEYDRLYDAVGKVGTAAQMAAKQQEGLYVQWKNLKDRAQLAAVSIGEAGLTAALEACVKGVSELLNAFNNFVSDNRYTATFIAITASVAPLVAGLLGLYKAIVSLKGTAFVVELYTAWSVLNAKLAASLGLVTVATTTNTAVTNANTAATAANTTAEVANTAAESANAAATGVNTASKSGLIASLTALSASIKVNTAAWALNTKAQMANALATVGFGGKIKALAMLIGTQLVGAIKAVGLAIRSTAAAHPLLLAITVVCTAIGAAFALARKHAERFDVALKQISKDIDAVHSSYVTFRDFEQATVNLAEGTDEYYNAMQRMLVSLKENKEATKLAGKEYGALLASVDTVNKSFNDGGVALSAYMMKLKEIEQAKVEEQLRVLGDRLKQLDGYMEKQGVREVKSSNTYYDEQGGSFDVTTYYEASWAAMKKHNDELAIGVINIEKMSKAEREAAKKFQEDFAEIQEAVHKFLNLKFDSGVLSLDSSLLDAAAAAISAGEKGTMLNAILEEFADKVATSTNGIYAMNKAFANSYKSVENFQDLEKYLAQANDEISKMSRTNLDLSGLENASELLREEAKAAKEVAESEAELNEVQTTLTALQKEYAAALLNNNVDKAASLIDQIKNKEKELIAARQEHKEKAAALAETQKTLAEKVANDELTILKRRLVDEIAAHDKILKQYEEQQNKLNAKVQQQLDRREISETQANERRLANQKLYNGLIKKEMERHADAVEKLKTNPIGADQYLEGALKAHKEYSDKIAVSLQAELNNIHKREDAYIKSNKEIGLSFEDARRAEQNAIAKAAAARIKDLEDRKKKMIEMYGAVDAAEQVEKIEQEIKKVQEDSLKKQHELKEKYAKLGAMLIAQRAKEVEAAAKEETEARKRAQEQALHDVAILEAKGVKSHEEAEREKTEITLKYIEEETKAKQAQIAALSSSDEARVENIDQIQRLKDDIQKNTDEIVKIRRKGIEDQTKIIREGTEKLRELQGSYDKTGAEAQLGDFSAKKQAEITQNYKEQLQRRKELGEENAKELEAVEKESLSKVAQEIQRHCAKREDIQAKTAEKIASLEKDLAQKQEDFEKKKLDIVKKYNAKRRDLQTSLQDKLHNIETSGLSGKKKEKADIDYARSKRNRAMSDMDEAIRSGDAQALDRISKELESAMGAFEGASKPKKYMGEIMGIYEALQKVIDAQEEIEKKEAERKNTQEVDAIQTKINSAMEAMQKSVAVEGERHTKAMTNLENEAEKIKKQVELAEQLRDVYTNSANQQTFLDQPPAAAQQAQSRAPRKDESSIPAIEGTFDKGVQDEIAKGHAAAESIKGAFTEATTAVQGAATQMAEGVVSAAGTAAEGVKTTVNNASTDFGLISKTIADTMSEGVRGTTEGMGMAQKTMMAAAKTGLNTYQKEVEGTVVTVATNMSQAQIEAFQAAAPAMKAMAKRGMEEIAEDAGKTPIDLQFKTNAELVAQMAVDEVLAAKDKADSTLEAAPLVFAASVDKDAPVTDAIQLAEDVSKRMSEIFEGQPPVVTPDVDTRGLEEMTQKANDTVQTISAKEPIDLTVQASEDAIQHTEQTIENLKESIVAEAAKLGITLEGDSVAEVKSEAEKLISDIDNRKASIKPELSQDDAEGVKYQLEKLLKDLEGQESILLQVQADKASIEAVHDVLRKLAKDISDREQILLKPGLDDAEKRKVLSEIVDLTKEAQSKVEAIKITAQSDEVKQEIAKVEAMLNSMTREVTTKMKADVNGAIQAINNYVSTLNKIPREVVTVVKTKYVTEGKKEKMANGGLVGAYATGGRVRRPEEEPEQYADGGQTFRRLPSRYINRGSGHKDDVPALLMKNEFVHRAAAVKKYGLAFMYKLNNLELPTSITKMFADGGLVSNVATSIQKFATGGLVKSARRKLEDMFAGSGVNLNVGNLNVVGKIEQAADSITSPIGVQALHTIAKSIESNVSKFAEGGPLTSTVLTTAQMSAISAKYNAVISQARQEGNAAIAKALSEEQANLNKLASSLKNNLDNLNITYNKQVQKLTEAHNKRIAEKEAEYNANVGAENESYGKRVESDNKAYAKEDEEYNKSIAQLKSDYEKELEELEKTLKEKQEAARKEEEQEAKEEAKTQKSYAKEDEAYKKSNQERKDKYQEDLDAAKKEYEEAQFQYEAELEAKKQAVEEKESEIENFKNQMASKMYPANSKKLREATLEEVMEAHIKQTKSENNGDEYVYAIDLGGTIKAAEAKPPTDAEIKKLKDAIRPRTKTEREHLNKLATIAYNPPYSDLAQKQMEQYNEHLNEATGYNAWKRAVEAKEKGTSLEDTKVKQNKPYRDYLASHYKTDYKHPLDQANKDLNDFLKSDTPKQTYDKKVAELKKEYDEAVKEAKEARAEVMEQRKEHEEQLAETRKNRAEELRQAQVDYNEGVAAAKEKYNADTSEAEASRKEALAERQSAIAERDKEHNDNLASYKKDYDDTVNESNASYKEDMTSAKEDYDTGVNDARSQYSEDVASLRESTQSAVDSAKDTMNSSISQANADLKEEFKSQEDAARTALEEKKDTYSTTKKEAEATLVSSVEQPSTTVAQQQAVEKATEKIAGDAVMSTYRMSVEELIRKLSKGLWKFAIGGLVPSTPMSKPNTDSVLSLLMPNEFVMSAKAVRTFGLDFMHSINNLRLPAFALGGQVGSMVASGAGAPDGIKQVAWGDIAQNKTIHALDLTINNTHIGELMGERSVIGRFIDEMQRAKISMGAMA